MPPRPKAPPKAPAPPPAKPWGLPQLLAVVVGGYAGLVAYGAWAGGQGPNPEGAVPDRSALFVSQLKAQPGPGGLLVVQGQVHNRAQVALRRAQLTVRLRDGAGRLINSVTAEVGAIPAGGSAPLEAKAAAQGAKDLEVEVERARFESPTR